MTAAKAHRVAWFQTVAAGQLGLSKTSSAASERPETKRNAPAFQWQRPIITKLLLRQERFYKFRGAAWLTMAKDGEKLQRRLAWHATCDEKRIQKLCASIKIDLVQKYDRRNMRF